MLLDSIESSSILQNNFGILLEELTQDTVSNSHSLEDRLEIKRRNKP